MAKFDVAVDYTLGFEGGYVNDPYDPGGETNFGISKRKHPDVDVASLTPALAKSIYYRDYWNPLYDHINSQRIANELFDFGVNAGPNFAVQALQAALRHFDLKTLADGVFGYATLEAVNASSADTLLKEFMAHEAAA